MGIGQCAWRVCVAQSDFGVQVRFAGGGGSVV